MATTINIWPGSGSSPAGVTPFGFYDSESVFVSDAPKVAKWCAYRLGYPIQDIELQDVQFYACFEEAITEYSYQVNLFNAKQNMLRLVGSPASGSATYVSHTQKNITSTGLGGIISISENYGQEANVGGHVDMRRTYFTTNTSTQVYDLWGAVTNSFVEQGLTPPDRSNVEIRRMWHKAPPAIARYFDPFAGTGMGTYSMMAEFGWTNYSVATSFMMLPIYADILRLQAIEFNDEVRRSGYGFEIINNKVRIFPKPTSAFSIWFDYILKSDRFDVTGSALTQASSTASDMSNIPFENMEYAKINSLGKQWIRDYTLALSKITLGAVRGKYATVPIPNNDTTLDGADLKTQGETERTLLIEQLQTMLDEFTRRKQLEKEAEETQNLQKTLQGVPLPIFIG